MKKITLTIGLMALMNIMLGAFIFYYVMNKPKMAYVQLPKMYSEFKMQKELQKQLEAVANRRDLILDSMEVFLKSLSSQLNGPVFKGSQREDKIREFEYRRQEYLKQKKTFTEETQRASSQYEEQIWKQLNQYISEYGKENNLEVIMGADGSGGLMYATEKMDITSDMIAYVNGKYKGLN